MSACVCCNGPVCISSKFALRYHLGTIAFASLVIATIAFVRACVQYIEQQMRSAQGGQLNQVQRLLFCCLKCCLKCSQQCMNSVSKNALIWTAIWGDSFIPASCSSFRLIFDNLLLVGAVSGVSGYLLVLGKLCICLCVTGICGMIFLYSSYFADHMSSMVMPLVVICILSYLTATMFMAILEVVIDTMLLCYLADCKNGGPRFAPKQLLEHLNDPEVSSRSKRIADSYNNKSQVAPQQSVAPHVQMVEQKSLNA
eukprot:TRINITY_DN6031_c0_g1_i1.p1 TRINITY_DN6031_c0_g1~~TRINITY_DN6031_c0_g1_i1.p1  ORF type:complete len:291 (+),score=40.91 TRINITY_DN6031_c0_g1_i1:109-873(+)